MPPRDCPIEALLDVRADEALPRPLLEAQFWLMGRDALHPDGNLLQCLGFVRESPPPGLDASARYRRAEPEGDVLLWRFGLHVGGRFLHRARTPIRCGPVAEVFTVDGLGGPACDRAELAVPLRWLARYEREIEALAGIEHRSPPPGAPLRIAPERACSLRTTWEALAETCVPGTVGPRVVDARPRAGLAVTACSWRA